MKATKLALILCSLLVVQGALATTYQYRLHSPGLASPVIVSPEPLVQTLAQGGLTWSQPEQPSVPRTLVQQQAYCQALVVTGLTNWRLPTRAQLGSFAQSNAIAGTNWPKFWYWSSERRDSVFVYTVSLDPAGGNYGAVSFINDPVGLPASCVR